MKSLDRDEVISSIINVSTRSAKSKEINIFEVGNLNDLVSKESAEQIRQEFVKHNTPIKQITNLRKFANWTTKTDLTQNLAVKYVPSETYAITNEVLIFDSTVAVYRLLPDPFYLEVNDKSYAQMMKNMFTNIWNVGDSLLMAADGSTQTKQYLPISYTFKDIPIVIYPAKDDGVLEKAFPRDKPGDLERYINSVVEANLSDYKKTDMILAYVWNQNKTPYCDIWKITRNDISDDSGLLYDVQIYKDHQIITDMGVASGNSSIVVAAEEMLLRDLVFKNRMSFEQAANRKLYQARFPIGFVPAEDFYKN